MDVHSKQASGRWHAIHLLQKDTANFWQPVWQLTGHHGPECSFGQ